MNLIKVNTVPSIFNRMDSVIDGFFNNSGYINSRRAKCNVIENDNAYSIQMEIPGIEKEDVLIECENEMLNISSVIKEDEKSNDQFNRFDVIDINRSFYLPDDVDAKKIDAQLKNGILEITIPRKALVKTKAKKITIK